MLARIAGVLGAEGGGNASALESRFETLESRAWFVRYQQTNCTTTTKCSSEDYKLLITHEIQNITSGKVTELADR